MVREGTVPSTEGGYGSTETARRVSGELLVVDEITLEYSTVLQNYTRSNDRWISVVKLGGSIGPNVLGHVWDAHDFVGILVVIVARAHIGWECFIIKDVRRRCSG